MGGVFGAYAPKGRHVLEDVYLGLYALQHRGQESAGVAWVQDASPRASIETLKGIGLLHNAINQKDLLAIEANIGIGQVRYASQGSSQIRNAQPIGARYARGLVAIAHDGAFSNATDLFDRLQSRGAIFQTQCDTEAILHLMAQQPDKEPLDALVCALAQLRGGYSLAVLLEGQLVAARDPWGFRPLVLGRRDDVIYVASESCALDLVGADFLRDVEPGEVLVIDDAGIESLRVPVKAERLYHCAFEYIYTARPDSIITGVSVYQARKNLGRQLAQHHECPQADFAIGMPDSGTLAALGYSEESQLPFELAMVRNRYVGRTFIQPTDRVRDLGVRIKLNPNAAVFDGKRVIVVDDSIVRGTTARRAVRMIRDCNTAAVHLRIASPPVRYPCCYGIDTPSSEELAACHASREELCRQVGADSLHYLGVSETVDAIGLPADKLCMACFDGKYLNGDGNGH